MSTQEETSLEERAFEDLDVINGLADAALVSMATEDYEQAETALKKIRELSDEWSDPDSDAWEEYEGI